MGAKSRRKGGNGERELSRVLCAAGFPARRGVQYQGSPDSPDVVCEALPGIHFESKRTERFNAYEAMAKAQEDAGSEKVPIVAHRRNDCEWLAVLRLSDLLTILRGSDHVVTVGDAVAAIGGTIESVEGA